jgi:thiol:disulfide interchange protein DsbD
VLALKVLGFVSKAEEHHTKVAKLGFVFAAGVVVSFLILAGAVIALQAAGERLGWGFQFQNPAFVAILATVLFVFSLSLLGVFEIGGIAAILGLGFAAAERKDYADAFFHGVLTTVLATPCTAPMLGAAVAFAFVQPPHVILLIFLAVAFGLASPYVLLSLNPGWLRYVPKPGLWMDRFKQAMGFLLLATLVWLLAVLGAHVGVAGLARFIGFLLVVGFFCWVHGAFLDLTSTRRRVGTIWMLTLAGLGLAYVQLVHAPLLAAEPSGTASAAAKSAETTSGGVTWQPFTPELLDESVRGGRTVFLDLTADWCWTCKVNEKTVLADGEVEAAFLRNGVLALKGDWTRKDPRITEILQRHRRAGVPFYAVYPADRPGEPIVLPEIINKRLVLESLEKAGPSRTRA